MIKKSAAERMPCEIRRHPLGSYLASQEGRFAIVLGRKVVAFYDDADVAALRASDHLPSGQYSIQRVDA